MAYLLELHNQIMQARTRIARAQEEIELLTHASEELEAQAWFCSNCEKFYPKDSVSTLFGDRTTTETVFTDAGYGDDDEIAAVTRKIEYKACPVCGFQKQVGEGTVIAIRDRRRRGG